MPSSTTTLDTVRILSLRVTPARVFLASSSSMQGTKKLYPFRNFDQSSWYVTDSIFILNHQGVQLERLGHGSVKLEHPNGG